MQEPKKYTRYEKTRIISARALQISQGSPVLIEVPKSMVKPVEIAKLEWEAGIIPIDIKKEERKEEKPEEKKEEK